MSETLSFKRLWLLIRSDFIGDYRTLLIVCATLAGIMLLASMVNVAQGGESNGFYPSWYFGMLFIWGSVNASFAFRELHDKTKNEAYLTLPASALEKTLARLFRSTIAFFAFLLIFLTVISAVIEGINWLVFGRANGIFNVAHAGVWQPVGLALVNVSLYFLGAAWFRRLHFVKTALTLTVIAIALMCFAALVFGVVFDGFRDMQVSLPGSAFRNYYLAHQGLLDALIDLGGILYFIGLPIFCWWVAYLRVKETEVSHGV